MPIIELRNKVDIDVGSGTLDFVGSINTDEGFATKLQNVSEEELETVIVDTEYLSPSQHGGRYGVVCRTYFDTVIPTYLTTGDYVSKLIDYAIYFKGTSDRHLGKGLTTHWAYGANKLVYINLSGLSGNGNLSLVAQGYTITDGWVDYIKAV